MLQYYVNQKKESNLNRRNTIWPRTRQNAIDRKKKGVRQKGKLGSAHIVPDRPFANCV